MVSSGLCKELRMRQAPGKDEIHIQAIKTISVSIGRFVADSPSLFLKLDSLYRDAA